MTEQQREQIAAMGHGCESFLRLANSEAQLGYFELAAQFAQDAEILSAAAFRVATGAAA